MAVEGLRLACGTPGHCLLWGSSFLVFFNLFVLTNSRFHCFVVVLQSDSHRAYTTLVFDYLVAPIAFIFTCFVLNIVASEIEHSDEDGETETGKFKKINTTRQFYSCLAKGVVCNKFSLTVLSITIALLAGIGFFRTSTSILTLHTSGWVIATM